MSRVRRVRRPFADLNDDELKLNIKSLSITYDATSKKLERLTGRHHEEALAEAQLCDRVLAKAKAEQSRRWRASAVS